MIERLKDYVDETRNRVLTLSELENLAKKVGNDGGTLFGSAVVFQIFHYRQDPQEDCQMTIPFMVPGEALPGILNLLLASHREALKVHARTLRRLAADCEQAIGEELKP